MIQKRFKGIATKQGERMLHNKNSAAPCIKDMACGILNNNITIRPMKSFQL